MAMRSNFFGLLFVFCFMAAQAPFNCAHAGIVLKVMAVNPSKEQTQRVSVKAYLPKEVKPEDIMDKGDLDTAYDTQQGSYYVYGDYELKPGESMERDIELRDIWVIPSSDIESIRDEANKIWGMLKNTEFSDRVNFLSNNIESKLNQIIESQANSPANPERHISEYRDNLKLLEAVKADLALARNLLSQVRPMPSVMVWRAIIAIVVFLGLIGVVFYFIWQKQAKLFGEDLLAVKEKDDADFASVEPLKKEEQKE